MVRRIPTAYSDVLAICVVLLGLFCWQASGADPVTNVVVVYNQNISESRALAEYYARRRHIPEQYLIGLSLPDGEVISRADYVNRLEVPLLQQLAARGFVEGKRAILRLTNTAERLNVVLLSASRIEYIVLCRGVPLKIAPDPNYRAEGVPTNLPERLLRNEAAVDSELASLAFRLAGLGIAGPLRNPLYTPGDNDSELGWKGVFCVARLDGPSWQDAYRLIDRALAAEMQGPMGYAYFDLRSVKDPGYAVGDQWIRAALDEAERWGFDCGVDLEPNPWPPGRPMPYPFLYIGWYAPHITGPLADEAISVPAGAIGYHIHSFSGTTLRTTNLHWVGPLIRRGFTATIGYVYEPYLQLTLDIGRFVHALLWAGMSFGQAAYRAMPVISWQATVVGDPLYRPFPVGGRLNLLPAPNPDSLAWKHAYVANRQLQQGEPIEEIIRSLRQHPISSVHPILKEKLASLYAQIGDLTNAWAAVEQALSASRDWNHKQALRIKAARLYSQGARWNEALRLVDAYLSELKNAAPDSSFVQEGLVWARKAGDLDRASRYQSVLSSEAN